MEDIYRAIPHRPPFLFVDSIVEQTADGIKTRRQIRADEPFFQGHFPRRPVMPGVLICEAAFQAGAILMAAIGGGAANRLPVITRIQNVRIKNPVFPGDIMEVEVTLREKLASAYYLDGRVRVGDKKILTVEFAAMLVDDIH
jgi:3-hydroxyacyl-[acyl-carrier-protein] dehydratase